MGSWGAASVNLKRGDRPAIYIYIHINIYIYIYIYIF